MKKIFLTGILAFVLVIAGCSSTEPTPSSLQGSSNELVVVSEDSAANSHGNTITVLKSSGCGCCVGWIAELEKRGFDVKGVDVADMASIKQKYNIPRSMESCHTAVIGNYFIEGHVPIEAVNKLMEERPDIDGIALPRMPAGSPGMPGVKKEPFKVYAISDGKISEFMAI